MGHWFESNRDHSLPLRSYLPINSTIGLYTSSGCVYKFELHSIQVNERRRKSKLFFADIFENGIEVDCPEELLPQITGSANVECLVVRMRKGKPMLVLAKIYKEKMRDSLSSIKLKQ